MKEAPKDRIGRVLRAESGRYTVQSGTLSVPCQLRGRLKKEKLGRTRNLVVGDEVRFILTGSGGAQDSEGVIEEILPRRNMISRLASGKSRKEQILMANLDLIFLVMAIREPGFAGILLDRFLVACEHRRLEAHICLNKCDLDDGHEADQLMAPYCKAGYKTYCLSALERRGLDELKSSMTDQVSFFLGPSGAGKSTILAAIQPGLELATQTVSRGSGMGRHTTTRTELHPLDFGGHVADSPGVREFGLWGVADMQLAGCFPEFRGFLGACRFPNCSHSHEPNCAVIEALRDGYIDAGRHESYLRILAEIRAGDLTF
ncbi:ribosome small subunit-dependent GTPase A [bacterium]|nr:ribosome small subunit-dependent GTPase A [bacterium]